MADGAILSLEVPDLVVLEVELDIEVEEVEDPLRNQAQRAVDVLLAMHRVGVRVTVGDSLRRQGGYPGKVASGTRWAPARGARPPAAPATPLESVPRHGRTCRARS